MKKYLIALLLLSSYTGYSQLSNLPSNISSINLFKDNPATIKIVFPDAYSIPTPVVSEVFQLNGIQGVKIASITPITTISGDTVKISLTAQQVGRLASLTNVGLYVKFNNVYLLGGLLKVSSGIGAPNNVPYTVTLPSIGVISINLTGSTGTAQRYARITDSLTTITKTASMNSQAQASLAIAAANTATSLSTTSPSVCGAF